MAVATDEHDTYICTRVGDWGWNEEIGPARLDIAAVTAEIAFAGGDNPEGTPVYVAIDTETGNGDVYKIVGGTAPDGSTATDLNVASTYGLSGIDIANLSAGDNNSATILLAGAADSNRTYASTDGGATGRAL